jgi:hypothetical protein
MQHFETLQAIKVEVESLSVHKLAMLLLLINEIKVGVASKVITSVPNLIKIGADMLEFKHTDMKTGSDTS